MIQQQQTRASPDVQATSFKDVVLSSLRYHLTVDGVSATKEMFRSQNEIYAHLDIWPEIKRECDSIILNYKCESDKALSVPFDQKLLNKVLKKNHKGRPIDYRALWRIIEQTFIAELRYGYEWLAPWRILYDLGLLEDTRLSTFAEQMNDWFPHASKPCKADSMGDYFAPYLGLHLFADWTEETFMIQKTAKQSLSGYRRLYNLCVLLKEQLSEIPVIR